MYFVYITTNLVNGKKYVGLCSMKKKNWESYLGSGKILSKAISKYGSKSFQREIIEYFDDKNQAILYEKKFILDHECHLSSEWYNIAVGYTTDGFKGKHHTEETKNRIAEHGRKRPSTKAMRENMSRLGKSPRTESQRKAFSENAKKIGKMNKGKSRGKIYTILTPKGIVKTDCFADWCREEGVSAAAVGASHKRNTPTKTGYQLLDVSVQTQ